MYVLCAITIFYKKKLIPLLQSFNEQQIESL